MNHGVYIFCKPENSVCEADVKQLVRHLLDDIRAAEPKIQWSFDPDRSNLSLFLGQLDDGHCVRLNNCLAKNKGYLLLEYCENRDIVYSLCDLCLEPDNSMLLHLYAMVAPKVHAAVLARGTTERTISHPE